LVVGFRKFAAVAHQATGHREIAKLIDGGHGMVERQRSDLLWGGQ
jgi:hypothetical protein